MSEMRSYEAARFYFTVLGIFSWIVIVVGGVVALSGLGAGSQFGRSAGAALAGLIPGLGLSLLGFLGLVGVQLGRATVDSAEYAQQSLKIAREQLEISRQALKQGATGTEGYGELQAARAELRADGAVTAAPPGVRETDTSHGQADGLPSAIPASGPSGSVTHYKGQAIEKVGNRHHWAGESFLTLGNAKRHIDQLERRDPEKLKLTRVTDGV